MPNFHETRMGQEFYLKNFPKLVKDIGRIANALESKNNLSNVDNNTIYCQKIDETVFAETLSDVTNGDVSIGYYCNSIVNFRSKKLNKELSFEEITQHLKELLKKLLDKEVKEIENINAHKGIVYIAFTFD